MTFVYLARPIDQAGSSSFLGTLCEEVEQVLIKNHVSFFKPDRAYTLNLQDIRSVEIVDQVNKYSMYEADAVVAVIPSGVPTLGVPAEVEQALMLNKPTVIITDIEYSVQVASWGHQGATVIRLTDDFAPLDKWDVAVSLDSLPREEETEVPPNTLMVKYEPGAMALTKAHPTDAGFDLATIRDATLHNGERVLLPTGVSNSVPEGWWGRITGRSSARTRWSCEVHEGVIDAGYTGELMIGVTYRGPQGHIDVPRGTRLAQYILHPVWDGELVEVLELPQTLRGNNGWGSSGH